MTIEGKGPFDIAHILFEDKIDTPAVYFGKQGKGICKPAKKSSPNSKKSYRQKKSIAKQRRQNGTHGRLK